MMSDLPLDGCVGIAGVVVVDRHGRLLLQERDDQAPTHPNLWSMCGGHVDEGESFDDAAVRELFEETGIGGLDLERWHARVVEQHGYPEDWRIYVAFSRGLTDADVVLGEGRQIRFVAPGELAGLDVVPVVRDVLDLLLSSEGYRAWCVAGDACATAASPGAGLASRGTRELG